MNKYMKAINIILFTLYIAFLLYLTLFKNYLGRNVGLYDINLIPLKNIFIITSDFIQNEVSLRFFIRNIFGNLVAFTPFAYFFLTLFKIKDTKKFIIFMFIIIFIIESLQHIFKIGFFDIDDIILNLLGSLIAFKTLKIVMKKHKILM